MDLSRNIGLLSEAQQAHLVRARVVVAGVGGMGGVAAEALVRMGVGTMTILDGDHYEASNINRQIHCTQSALGRRKVDVVAERLRDINPGLKLATFGRLEAGNVDAVVAGADIVINAMDDVRASLLLERTARARGRVVVNAWITPYASVLVTTPQAPHWEDFLGFPTRGKPIESITDADVRECLLREAAYTLQQFEPFKIITQELVEGVLDGTRPRPSLVPVVWLSGVLMANEVMKIVTAQGRLASHLGVFYNQYTHEVRYIMGEAKADEDAEPSRQKLAG